jgi:hypothetical protein
MTATAALVAGLLLVIGLTALVALLAGVPVLAVIVGSAITALAAFYLLTYALRRQAPEKSPSPTQTSHGDGSDHIS